MSVGLAKYKYRAVMQYLVLSGHALATRTEQVVKYLLILGLALTTHTA